MTPSIREAAGAVPPTVGGATRGLINSVPKAGKIKISPWDRGSCSPHGSGRHQGLAGEPGFDAPLAQTEQERLVSKFCLGRIRCPKDGVRGNTPKEIWARRVVTDPQN